MKKELFPRDSDSVIAIPTSLPIHPTTLNKYFRKQSHPIYHNKSCINKFWFLYRTHYTAHQLRLCISHASTKSEFQLTLTSPILAVFMTAPLTQQHKILLLPFKWCTELIKINVQLKTFFIKLLKYFFLSPQVQDPKL